MNVNDFTAGDMEKISHAAAPSKFTVLRQKLVFNRINRAANRGNHNVTLAATWSTPDIFIWLTKKGFKIEKRKIYLHDDFGTKERWEYKVSW